MVNDKESKKRFKAIMYRKEKQGYIDWKNWVKEQIKDYDEVTMLNLIKRTEIKLKRTQLDDEMRLSSMVTTFAPIILSLITLITTIGTTVIEIQTNVSSVALNEDTAVEYVAVLTDLLKEMMNTTTMTYVGVTIVCMLYFGVAKIVDCHNLHKNNINKIYYEELINVLTKD